MMAKYLFMGKFTTEGTKALRQDKATARREAVSKLAASVGGHLESLYYSFGGTDSFAILDLPSPEAAAAVVLAVNSGGGIVDTFTQLLSAEQVDAALDLAPEYRAPGA